MISNICKIEKGTKDLEAILKESESVALYNGFTQKQTLQLRLLCEELDGMLPNLIDDFDGDFWIEYDEGTVKVNATVEIPRLNITKKEELISVAKNKKNAYAVGIVGKIRNAIENLILYEGTNNPNAPGAGLYYLAAGYSENVDYSYVWSLNKYKVSVQESEKEAWDELEKSIIANLADDVIVGVKGKQASIVVVKNFN